jgi:hypothetical protein
MTWTPEDLHRLASPGTGTWWAYAPGSDVDAARDSASTAVIDAYGLNPSHPTLLDAEPDSTIMSTENTPFTVALARAAHDLRATQTPLEVGTCYALAVSADREWARRRLIVTLTDPSLPVEELDVAYGRIDNWLAETLAASGITPEDGEILERLTWRSLRARHKPAATRADGDRSRLWTVRDSSGLLLAEMPTAGAARREALILARARAAQRPDASAPISEAAALLADQGSCGYLVQAEARRGGTADTAVRLVRASLTARGQLTFARRKPAPSRPIRPAGWIFYGQSPSA